MFFSRNTIPDPVPESFIQDQSNFEVIDTINILTNDQYICSEQINDNIENNDIETEINNEDIEINNNEDNDENEDDDNDDEYEEEEEEEIDDENTIYVISFNNKPFTYERDLVSAKNNIDFMAKKYNLNDVEGYHTSYINYKNEHEINIIRSFDFGLFSFNYVMHTFSIYRLQK